MTTLKSAYPVKTSLKPLTDEERKLDFIKDTSLRSIIEPTKIYSSAGAIEWKNSPLNSLTFLVANEFGFDSSAIVHWDLQTDEQGNISNNHTIEDITRFNEAFNYQSYAFRWPNNGITECLFQGYNNNLQPNLPLHEALGLKFTKGKKVGKGKKRMHIFGLAQGAFLCNIPSSKRTVHLSPTTELTWTLEPPAINDTNDGGGTCTRTGLRKILDNSNIPYTEKLLKKIDAVQLVIITTENIIKGIFVITDDNVIPTDLSVPEPSLVYELTSTKYTMGKVNLIKRKKNKNWVSLEPVQVVPNYLNFADHTEVAEEIHRASLQAEVDIYNELINNKSLLEHYDQLTEDKNINPISIEPSDLNILDLELAQEMRKFVKASSEAGHNSPYTNTVVMEQTMSGMYRHIDRLIKHWGELPGIIVSGGRHYITYAPHAGEPNPPPGYMGIIYWDDICKTCHSKTCHNHFERDIRRISINPIDCDERTRDLLDGFDMDDSCFWTLLRGPVKPLKAWIGRNPMSPDRGLVLSITPQDEEILVRRGYKAIKQVGEWKIPDLWKIEETLKLGELENIPEWTWIDKEDLNTCLTLASKTGGLGQLALYTSAFQYSGQWDINRHHILNSNIVDAQTNADADLDIAVRRMQTDFKATFIDEQKPINKYIVKRMQRMLPSIGLTTENFTYGNSPKLGILETKLRITKEDLQYRDEIRKLLSNGPASHLTTQFDEYLVSIVLTLAKQIRHEWTNYFNILDQLDVSEIDIDPTELRQKVTKTIKNLTTTTYQKATQLPNYIPGEFTSVWMQIQATKDTRFYIPDDQKFARSIISTPLINLPEQEIYAGFYGPYTQPTWITRMIENEFLIQGGVYSVEQGETGIIYLLDGDNNIAGTLLPESKPIIGQIVQYFGPIPKHHQWTEGSTENWNTRETCGVFYINHTLWQEYSTKTVAD